MKVRLHHPSRSVHVDGPIRARVLCEQLGYNRESVLVVRGDDPVLGDAVLEDGDSVEIIPAISGGAV